MEIPNEYVSIAGGLVGYIGGDNRMNSAGNAIWDEFSDRYRTRSAIRADFTNNRVEADRSNSYPYIDSRGLAISVTGRYNGNKRLVEEQLAEADTFTRSNSSINSSRASWDLEHSVGIPLFMELPPNIDYNYSVNITSNGSGSVSGVHDLAPAHEVAVYIPKSGMSFLVYTKDNEGFNNLFPTHGNQRFNASF